MASRESGFEQVIICPYNNAHQILSHRMSTHLVKCRRQHPNEKTVQCVFNSTHIVAEPEWSYHMNTCVDRIIVDKDLYVPENTKTTNFPVVIKDVNTEESWDNLDVETYNPETHCMQNPILRRLDVASHKERKDFRESERRRFQQIEQNTNITQKAPGCRKPGTQSNSIATSSRQIDEADPEHLTEFMENLKFKQEQPVAVVEQEQPVAVVEQEQPIRPLSEIMNWTKVVGKKGPTKEAGGAVKQSMVRLGTGRGRAMNK